MHAWPRCAACKRNAKTTQQFIRIIFSDKIRTIGICTSLSGHVSVIIIMTRIIFETRRTFGAGYTMYRRISVLAIM